MGDADCAIARDEAAESPATEKDTTGHNTIALQLGWDVPAERRRQAERAVRDDRPHVQARRGLLGRLRRR